MPKPGGAQADEIRLDREWLVADVVALEAELHLALVRWREARHVDQVPRVLAAMLPPAVADRYRRPRADDVGDEVLVVLDGVAFLRDERDPDAVRRRCADRDAQPARAPRADRE